ncbi:uncharacterized protein LOC118436530 isoform X2 [Folsomia candida]|uniref:uncharacterized protein LOC118436530 isoform X2 n=1 Tax=Folsomia candida TaxID=158441 RepID=UPI001604D95A|nr:uncharacterized protein LOC118436530 isoform X2 [Folsomia candida]
MGKAYCPPFAKDQLEFTIHVLDEFDISRSVSPDDEDEVEELPVVKDDVISELVDIPSNREGGESRTSSSSPDSNMCDEHLAKLKTTLEERTTTGDLLQDLKAMKEEAWAKRKARKMRRDMKKVQFQDEDNNGGTSPFCRSCCTGRKNYVPLSILMKSSSNHQIGVKRESETSSTSGESTISSTSSTDFLGGARKGVFADFFNNLYAFLNFHQVFPPTPRSYRPIAHIHSINMFENIIPRKIMDRTKSSEKTFVPFNTPIAKMLADIA